MLDRKYIHDTLTSGLRLDVESDSYDRILKALSIKEGEAGIGIRRYEETVKGRISWKEKEYLWKTDKERYSKEQGKTQFGTLESHSWLIHLLRYDDDEHFTTVGIKLSKENVKTKIITDKVGNYEFVPILKYFLTIKANPTSIMRCDFALESVEGVTALYLLTAPFEVLVDVIGNDEFLTAKEWDRITAGDLGLQDIEIAFPLEVELDKSKVSLWFNRLYAARMSFNDKEGVMDMCTFLNCTYERYPQGAHHENMTGFMINALDKHANQRLFTLKMYDKVAEMMAKGKNWKAEDQGRMDDYQKYLRVDIRIYPAFMLQLEKESGFKDKGNKNRKYSMGDWINIEHKHNGNFAKWLLRQVLNHLEFPFLTATKQEVDQFATDLGKEFGEKVESEWRSKTRYNVKDLIENMSDKSDKTFYRYMKKSRCPLNIGGLVFDMHNFFNFTSSLTLEDLKGVSDLHDAARRVDTKNKARKSNESFDSDKISFREPIMAFCGHSYA